MEVAAWLRELGLERYELAFRENDVDADVLPQLTAEDLTALGVTAVGHRRKLLDAIAALRRTDDAPATGAPANGALELAADTTASTLSEGERRQVTVLFADLAGYTKLTDELDAEEVHTLLGCFFDRVDGIIEGYGGTVDKHIGDCVMATFGAPVAHHDDAGRAVRAALDIRGQVPGLGAELGRPIGVHIGVASGQVVASGAGGGSHREYTVTGESVNLASRLTEEAEEGEILISDAVHRVLADRLGCDDVGEVAVKGLAKPVRVWRLLAFREATGASSRRPFVGHQGELRQFEAALTACRTSGFGQAFYVRGEAGIGKTRLVEEFQAAADRDGFACHCGLVLDFGAGIGQDAIRSLVRSLLGLSSTSEQVALEAAAARALAENLVATDRRVHLNDLLDVPQPLELRALYDAMDNAARNRGKRETVAELVARASGKRVQLLVVEDLHWADQLTLDHLAALTETVAGCPAILLMTSRIEGDPLDHAWRSRVAGSPLMTVDLGPLRPQEAEALAGTYFDVLGELARRCIERAGGNPLFLEQLLRHAEESAETGVPGSVQSLVQARVDRLDPDDRRAAQAASVFGQRFDLEALNALLQRSDYDCAGLVRHFLVRPQGEQFMFAHALIQEAVYESLLKAGRRELHRRAAHWFARRDLVLHAEHLERAEDPAAPQAYLAASRAQIGDYHYERARRLVQRGLAIAVDRHDIFAITCLHGEILHDLGAVQESIDAYQSASTAAQDDVERCHAWFGLAAGMRMSDRHDEALAALDQAEKAARTADLPAELSRIHHLRGNIYFPLGNIEGCVQQHDLALWYARQASSAVGEARALGGLGDAAYVRGQMLTAHRNFRRCVEVCREHGFGRIEVANSNMAALTRQYANELPQAAEDALAAAEAATRVGHHRAQLLAHNIAAFALYDLAELARARDQLERAAALIEHISARRFVPENRVYLAKICRAEGRLADARALLGEAIAASRETGIRFFGPRVLVEIALSADDLGARNAALEEGERLLGEGCVGHNHLWFYRDAIDAALSVGDWDGAERYASRLTAFTHDEPLPWSDFFIARGRALAGVGRGHRTGDVADRLCRLREEAARAGLNLPAQAIERALAT